MTKRNPMICPECGIEMNQHAEKIDYASAPDEWSETDSVFGGVLEEVHSCPACGRTQMRRSE